MTRVAYGFVLLLSAVACSGDLASTGAYCASPSHPSGCGQSCSAGLACPLGLYCSAGHCNADCNASTLSGCNTGYVCGANGACTMGATCNAMTGAGCPTGQTCGANGFCMSVAMDAGVVMHDGMPPNDDNTCASFTLNGSTQPPNVILMVDRSGSMAMNQFGTGGMTRWEVLYDTLMNPTTGLVTRLQSTVRFGLALFTGSDRRGTCPDLIEVLPPALNNRAAIDVVYAANPPGSNTPTGEDMNKLVMDMQMMTFEPGPTIILLATDGEPNTCASTNTTDGVGLTAAINAATAAHTAGFPVYAIGVASDVGQANLSMISQAGGGGDAYSVTDATSLSNALEAIVGGVVSCTVTLNGTIDPALACQGVVTLAGTQLPCMDPNGWTATDGSHIVLQGTACTSLMNTGGPLTGVFPCNVIVF